MPPPQSFDVIVLGAGAAGLMCAIEAGHRGRRVLVLDHAERVGKKILISGGGRCNFTNLHARAENYLSQNPHFAKSALARFTPADIIARIEKHGIPYHEKTLGQLFCDRSAHDVVRLLETECAEAGVRIVLSASISAVSRDTGFLVETGKGSFRAGSLVVATGGLSIPKMGATSLGYDLARQFGLKIVPCRPGLVPLLFSEHDRRQWSDLTGLSFEAIASTGTGKRTPSFREKALLTHRGLSGPAILQISSYWQPGEPIRLDLAPDKHLTEPLLEHNARRDPATALQALKTELSTRLAERWLTVHPPTGWSNTALEAWERQLHGWEIVPTGTEGYAKAEVTVGGIDTAELDARTLESRRVPGLYFIGEVVDVTGWLGGYNFQWAWASGFSAGQAV
ncbi:MAG TPA: NAD(P)/FAD-dependent oxidoreductase [Granulicella sp.]